MSNKTHTVKEIKSMKKSFALFAVFLLMSGALFAQINTGGKAWVSSKLAEIKASPWFFAPNTGSLEMGAKVAVLQVNGNWAEVRCVANASLSGWTAVSNLSARRIVSSGTGAAASEIATAGKGFNQELEDFYRASGNHDYATVDKTEAITFSQDDLFRFVTEGSLNTGE